MHKGRETFPKLSLLFRLRAVDNHQFGKAQAAGAYGSLFILYISLAFGPVVLVTSFVSAVTTGCHLNSCIEHEAPAALLSGGFRDMSLTLFLEYCLLTIHRRFLHTL